MLCVHIIFIGMLLAWVGERKRERALSCSGVELWIRDRSKAKTRLRKRNESQLHPDDLIGNQSETTMTSSRANQNANTYCFEASQTEFYNTYTKGFTRLDKSTNALFFFKLNLHRGDRSVKKEEYRPKKLFCVEKRSILNSFTLFKVHMK